MRTTSQLAFDMTEKGLIPDHIIRQGIRRLVKNRLQEIATDNCEEHAQLVSNFVESMNRSPIALLPEKANEQHYEVSDEFFRLVLGDHLKYSCCYWTPDTRTLSEAESNALGQVVERAEIENGMDILELGCGWGSLSLWLAANFPDSSVVSVSNSASQRNYIVSRARQQGLQNLEVITCDMNNFDTSKKFDRVVSVEMFEHMRNYQQLFSRIDHWLKPDGAFFMHIFCHRSTPYEFIDNGPSDWMSRHFFSGGIMPSDELPLLFQQDLRLQSRWRLNGMHYQKTAEAWLSNMDSQKQEVIDVLADIYGRHQVAKWWMRWRLFFMACSELFGYEWGDQWWVSHYLFRKQRD